MSDLEPISKDAPVDDEQSAHEIEQIIQEVAPEIQDEKKATLVRRLVMQEFYSGPIPSPRNLRQFDDIVPGAAREILNLHSKQVNHRIGLENLVVKNQTFQSWFGQIAGLLIVSALLWMTYSLAIKGHTAVASILGGTTIAAVAAIFFTQKKKQEEAASRPSD